MLEILWKLLGRHTVSNGPATDVANSAAAPRPSDRMNEPVDPGDREPTRHRSAQRIGAHRRFAKMTAENLAFGVEDGKYRIFKVRSDAGMRRLLGCGPTVNVDGTPMVGDTGFDERGKPYGVTEDFG